jgi:hypothetical protein
MQYVQSRTPDDGRKDHPKHVERYSMNRKNFFDISHPDVTGRINARVIQSNTSFFYC